MVVDRLTKYAHFIPLAHPYSVQSVFQALMDNVIKLHGIPLVIISDRDRIFTSKLYKELFAALNVELRFSTTDHPQTDGQTERVNQCLEAYLRGMVFQEPKQWIKWLPLAELWYNTSYHTSLKCTPFEALYGYKPPQICEFSIPNTLSSEAQITLENREQMIQKLKENLLQAQNRIKFYADMKRTERQFDVGDMVYLKVQPYRQNAFGLRGSLKLRSKFYGPFKVLQKVGNVSYKLHLPEGADIHPVFHVSQLKKHIGHRAVPLPHVPLVTPAGYVKTYPVAVLDRRIIQRNKQPIGQCLVQWESLAPDDATWEDASFLNNHFPGHKLFHLEDKAILKRAALSGPRPRLMDRTTLKTGATWKTEAEALKCRQPTHIQKKGGPDPPVPLQATTDGPDEGASYLPLCFVKILSFFGFYPL